MITRNITDLSNLDDLIIWLDTNPEIAEWTMKQPLKFEDGKIYISSIAFFNEEDCIFYSLKFGLR